MHSFTLELISIVPHSHVGLPEPLSTRIPSEVLNTLIQTALV
jgi:hypothetical protein